MTEPIYTLKIKSVRVVIGNGSDRVYIFADLPSGFPKWMPEDSATLELTCEHRFGAQYVRDVFGVEPEIIDHGPEV